MPRVQITATRDGAGGWSFAIPNHGIHAHMITVADAVNGSTMWAAASGDPGEPVYKATAIAVGPIEPMPLPLPPSGEISDEWMVAQLRAMGEDPELWAFRDRLRTVSKFDYGAAPHGFQTMTDAQPLPLVPGHTYVITLTGSFLVPVATGMFIA